MTVAKARTKGKAKPKAEKALLVDARDAVAQGDGAFTDVSEPETPGGDLQVLMPSSRRNLRPPWQPGQSGNPGGRSEAVQEALRIARQNSPAAMAALVGLLNDSDPRVVAVAANSILDRAMGRPKVAEIERETSGPQIDLQHATAEELAVIGRFVVRSAEMTPAETITDMQDGEDEDE